MNDYNLEITFYASKMKVDYSSFKILHKSSLVTKKCHVSTINHD